MILTGLTALATARSMQTRRLTIAQDDPSVTKVVKLAQLLREIFAQITTVDGKCTADNLVGHADVIAGRPIEAL